MPNIKILDKEHLELLRHVQKIMHKQAIIAGGAVRDMVMGKPYRDIDIWIRHKRGGNLAKAVEYILPHALKFDKEDFITQAHGFGGRADGPLRVGEDNDYQQLSDKPIKNIINMKFKGDNYQLMM